MNIPIAQRVGPITQTVEDRHLSRDFVDVREGAHWVRGTTPIPEETDGQGDFTGLDIF